MTPDPLAALLHEPCVERWQSLRDNGGFGNTTHGVDAHEAAAARLRAAGVTLAPELDVQNVNPDIRPYPIVRALESTETARWYLDRAQNGDPEAVPNDVREALIDALHASRDLTADIEAALAELGAD